jgi:hypothetical protein
MFEERLYGTESTEGKKESMYMKARRNWRWFTIAALVGLGVVYTGVAASGNSAAGSSGNLAPSAVLTVDHATKVANGASLRPLKSVPLGNLFINRPAVPMSEYRAAKQQRVLVSRPGTGPAPLFPVHLGGFAGITQATAEDTWPPDINGAVGKGGFADGYNVQVVNQHYTAYHKGTVPGAALCDMSYNTRTGNAVNSMFDPRIEYDPYWDRWVDQVESSGASQHQYLMISLSRNPCGGYWIYDIGGVNTIACGGTSPFWDYPQIALSQDAVVLTANCFDGPTFVGAKVIGFSKARLYNGLGVSVPVYTIGCGTTTPNEVIDANPRMHLLARCGSVMNVEFRNPQTAFYSAIPSVTAVAGLAPSTPASAGQAGCFAASCTIDTADGRYVNPGSQYGDDLWAVASWGALATPRWADIDTEGVGANTLKQGGFTFLSTCSADYNASIAATNDGRAWLNWTSSAAPSCGGGALTSINAASRLPGDGAGTMPSIGSVAVSCCTLTGNFDQRFGTQRWGDTSSVSTDPSAGDRAWYWNEVAASSSIWGTRSHLIRNP